MEFERLLTETDERYRRLVEACHDAIVISRHERILFVNPSATAMFGARSPSELVGRPIAEVVHPEYRHLVRRRVKRVATRQCQAERIYERLLRIDGAEFDAEVISIPVDYRGQPAVQTIIRDTSEEHHARRELERAQAILLGALENAPVGITVVDAPEGRIRLANPAWRSMCTGKPLDAIMEASFARYPDWVYLDEQGRRVTGDQLPLIQALESGLTTRNQPFTLLQANGQQRWVMVTAAPIRDASGEIVAAVSIVPDLTDYRTAEGKQKQLESQLLHAQKMEALGYMAGGVAHDFNNLMAIILGQTELLLIPTPGANQPPIQHEVRGVLELIEEVCRKATSLTNDLMQFSRRRVVVREMVDPVEIIESLGPMLRRLVGKHTRLHLRLDRSGSRINANTAQVEQVMMNLVINARDALERRGGEITIETSVVPSPEDEPSRFPGAIAFQMSVADDGIGMEESVLERIFEPFFTTKPEGVGTGLGLSTVYGIVRESGGCIRVESEPGRGTAFHVYWPITDVAPPTA